MLAETGTRLDIYLHACLPGRLHHSKTLLQSTIYVQNPIDVVTLMLKDSGLPATCLHCKRIFKRILVCEPNLSYKAYCPYNFGGGGGGSSPRTPIMLMFMLPQLHCKRCWKCRYICKAIQSRGTILFYAPLEKIEDRESSSICRLIAANGCAPSPASSKPIQLHAFLELFPLWTEDIP